VSCFIFYTPCLFASGTKCDEAAGQACWPGCHARRAAAVVHLTWAASRQRGGSNQSEEQMLKCFTIRESIRIISENLSNV